MARKNCQSSSLYLDSLTLTIDVSCLDTLKVLDLSCLNFPYRSSKKNFGHSIRYAKSYADLNSNSISFQNKRENNLVCLSFRDKIKSQIFTLKIKKTDENKEVNYVQSV